MAGVLTSQKIKCLNLYLRQSGTKNITKAAIDAGYSKRSASSQGSRLLKSPEGQAYIAKFMSKMEEETEVTVKRVLMEYAKIAFFDIKDCLNDDGTVKQVSQMPENIRGAVSGLDIEEIVEYDRGERKVRGTLKKIRFSDKKGTLDSLGKHLQMFIEKKEYKHSGLKITDLVDAEEG